MKDSQQILTLLFDLSKYIKADNERFSTGLPGLVAPN